ncbi:MAG: hypothetical protein COX62_01370 [Deltaproteobacteria bacterium CG_4_10_14_0_2_um_filter_43_8]|nr:MAG: hypothetical protein COV43_08420 [Deltaproteobacteria bacterium CG11_big_fil_rev_8_21_14_0_20_42_23]PJA21824.1 MAG: hypothetical protein COX62_01370 [Deltaproteobacteria bacterium CG_4_10_14_0_2_um_filter_43_8]PJC63698.1 MAG: hypothetical protein CO021_08170 [Deltaproteobacteria bacterium CG_4_9_14_0_2_um_filter_42_21]
MSLQQKYTWKAFLAEHPELKEKAIKRTSDEGKKAFEAAYKKHIKAYLAKRAETIGYQQKRAQKERDLLNAQVKELNKAKKLPLAKLCQQKLGKKDAWLARLAKQTEKVKTLQKAF